MVKFCESVECRHGMFAKYFGDEKPKCKKQCDVCTNKLEVEENLNTYLIGSGLSCRTTAISQEQWNSDFGNLYGSGRKGVSEDCASYSEEGTRSPNSEINPKLTSMIKKQLSLRRASQQEIKESDDDDDDYKVKANMSKLRAAESTKLKIHGLTIKVREGYVKFLQELLQKNYDQCSFVDPPDTPLNVEDIEQAALDLEYQAFTSNKAMSVYRRAIAKLSADVKDSTKKMSLYILLKSHQPQNVQQIPAPKSLEKIKQPKTHQSFVKASQLLNATSLTNTHSFESKLEKAKEKGVCQKSVSSFFNKLKKETVEQVNLKPVTVEISDDESRSQDQTSIQGTNNLENSIENVKTPKKCFFDIDDIFGQSPNEEEEEDSVSNINLLNNYENTTHKSFKDETTSSKCASKMLGTDHSEMECKILTNLTINKKRKLSEDSVSLDEEVKPFSSECERKRSRLKIESFNQNADQKPIEQNESKEKLKEVVPNFVSVLNGKKYLEDVSIKSKKLQIESPTKIIAGNLNYKVKLADVHKDEGLIIKNPNEQNPSPNKMNKEKVSDTVIKYLMPFYKQNLISDKDLFKYLARTVVHQIIERENLQENQLIKKLVQKMFQKKSVIRNKKEVDHAVLSVIT